MSDVPVKYFADVVASPEVLFMQLRDELSWVRREGSPRDEYYCNDLPVPYTYGRGAGRRTYEVQPWHPFVLQIREVVQELAKARFEVCFLNRYHTHREHLGWHADDSPEMDDARPIAIVSLGAVREIWFRRKIPDGFMVPPVAIFSPTEKLTLHSGSMCVMAPGMQDAWEHRIPKASYECGERISLTFRGYAV